MNVQDLDGNIVKWCPWKGKQNKRVVSKLQQRAVDAIQTFLPGTFIIQEVALPIKPKKTLYLDIWLPRHRIGVETHGKQHEKQTKYFHNTKQFIQQQRNDELKAEFFRLNNIPLVIFWHDESEDTWIWKLKKALGTYNDATE